MSKVSRKQRARNARVGTVAADHRIDIKDEPEKRAAVHHSDDPVTTEYVSPLDSFTDEELETMPLTIVNATRGRVQVWRGPDGSWYRHGALLRIQPGRDGVGSRFCIVLLRGSNRDDLDAMMQAVKRVRAGRRELQWVKRDWGWADDRTFSYAFTSRTYVDPYTHGDRSPDVTACTQPLCTSRWHEAWDVHELDSTSSDRAGVGYEVRVTKRVEDDDASWEVQVHVSDFAGSPEQVAAFVSDLQWMQEACKRANDVAQLSHPPADRAPVSNDTPEPAVGAAA